MKYDTCSLCLNAVDYLAKRSYFKPKSVVHEQYCSYPFGIAQFTDNCLILSYKGN